MASIKKNPVLILPVVAAKNGLRRILGHVADSEQNIVKITRYGRVDAIVISPARYAELMAALEKRPVDRVFGGDDGSQD